MDKKYSEKVIVYTVIVHQTNISYSKWSTRLQSMFNHIVGRTVTVISPFYYYIVPEVG